MGNAMIKMHRRGTDWSRGSGYQKRLPGGGDI